MAVWKNGLQSKGLKVNIRKTKVMILGRDLDTLQTSGKYPCPVSMKGFGKNPKSVVDVCFGFTKSVRISAWPIDGQTCSKLADGKLDVVDKFVYLADCIYPGGGSELANIKRSCFVWEKSRKL